MDRVASKPLTHKYFCFVIYILMSCWIIIITYNECGVCLELVIRTSVIFACSAVSSWQQDHHELSSSELTSTENKKNYKCTIPYDNNNVLSIRVLH